MNVRNGIENLLQIFSSQTASVTSAAKSGNAQQTEAPRADTAQLSSVGTQAAGASGVSDVRLDKVASIQAALQAGTYHVPAADVAQKLIGSMLDGGK